MELQLANKSVFISGSTSGIGFAMAQGFLQEGAQVIINGRSEESIQEAIQKLKTLVPQASVSGIVADFRDAKAIEHIQNQLDQVDILINNVGVFASKSFQGTSDQDWQEMFQVNVMSAVQLSKYFLPKMLDQNWGDEATTQEDSSHGLEDLMLSCMDADCLHGFVEDILSRIAARNTV